MSQENVETARRGYEHFIATGDVLAEVFDPEFILDMSKFRDWPERREYHGVQGLREFLHDWLEPWDEYEFQLQELREVGDKVVAAMAQLPVDPGVGLRYGFGRGWQKNRPEAPIGPGRSSVRVAS
jgi:hypothetical protein